MNAFMRPETDVRFLPVELTSRRWYHDRRPVEASLHLDPVLWSDDGKTAPGVGTVWSVVAGSLLLENVRNRSDLWTWYYLCRGPNAAKVEQYPIEPVQNTVDAKWITQGDVFEFGTIHDNGQRRKSWRRRYVVLEAGVDRLVVHEMPTLAQAMRLGNAVKGRLAHDPDRFRRRREAWEESQRPRTIEEDIDDAMIEDVFL